ncbi:MAG: ribonuclease III [Lachnospiraceae bacterium]|nr:ribonuclease III [Lachnospiraceae bacterium]
MSVGQNDLEELQGKIDYHFQDINLLKLALTHSSYANEKKYGKRENNERVEFLGDAVLEINVSDYLYRNYPQYSEGKMTKVRSSLVCEYTLAIAARDINLGQYLLLSKGEDMTGGRERDSILSDAFESVIGAIYLDGGMKPAKEFISTHLLKDVEDKSLFYDAKTILQEIVQAEERELTYELTGESGPDHNKRFTVEVQIDGTLYASGTGKTKKGAEQIAAYQTILYLKKHPIGKKH